MRASNDPTQFSRILEGLPKDFSDRIINHNPFAEIHEKLLRDIEGRIDTVVNNNNSQSQVEINQTFNGVTSEKFIDELPKHMKVIADRSVMENNNRQNKMARAKSLTGSTKATS